MNTIRLQRSFLRELRVRQLIDATTYRDMYRRCKGGFLRSKRHLTMYLNEHKLIRKAN